MSAHVHDQRFWGDDPYLICNGCGAVWDALTGRPLNAAAATTTRTAEHGGPAVTAFRPWPDPARRPATGQRATVHHGRPVTMGPAVCQGCASLVWWSGGLWVERDGRWHRCAS